MTGVDRVGLGVAALLLGGLTLGSAGAHGSEKMRDGARDEKVRVIRVGGGARLGVRLEDVDKDDVARLKLQAESGAIVKSVDDGSPAEKAGLKEGDVIVRFDGEGVRSAAQLARLVRETPAGRTVPIEVSRDGSSQELSATLSEGHGPDHVELGDLDLDFAVPPMPTIPNVPGVPMPPMPPDGFYDGHRHRFSFDRAPRKLGIEYQDVTGQLARYFKVESGVLVTSVDEDSPAARAGLRAGDVIVRFEGKAVAHGMDLRDGVSKAEGGQEVLVGVLREGKSLDLKVKLASSEGRHSGDVRL
jgi:serine protease Do